MKLKLRRGARTDITSPIASFNKDGILYGHNGEAWLYRIMPQTSLRWEDAEVRNLHAVKLHTMLSEIGARSRTSIVPGSKVGAYYREFHILQLAWDAPCMLPVTKETHPKLIEWATPVLNEFTVIESLFAVGVKLRQSTVTKLNPLTIIKKQIATATTEKPPDIGDVAADRALIGPILNRAGGRPPTTAEVRRLEAWWNGGRTSDGIIIEEPDGRSLSTDFWPEGLEMAALIGFDKAQLDPEHGLWAADAFAHIDGCVCLSIRGELMPAKAARVDFRKSQRKAIAQIKEQAAVADLEREEDTERLEVAQLLESLFVQNPNEPLIRRSSVTFARRASARDESYTEMLSSSWGIRVKPVEFRQHAAFCETLPCSSYRLPKTFQHDMTAGMVSCSGIGASCAVGDEDGVWMGVTLPDAQPVWLDPAGSSKQNKPPAFAVVGEPGSGKTFFLQLLATQAAHAGFPVVYINPKPADSLDGFAVAAGGEVIRISTDGSARGMLDPFRYAPTPPAAADIAASHLLTVLSELSEDDEVRLQSGLRRAAMEGARCVADALKHRDVPRRAAKTALLQAEGSALFGMGIGEKPMPPIRFSGDGRITLIEFDRALPLPAQVAATQHYSRPERIAVAAVKLVAQAAVEQMFAAKRGVLIVDEAHVLLGSREGRGILERLGREGRSQRILPVMATQRIADLIGGSSSLESYTGRALILKMTEPSEVAASMRLVGLEKTQERTTWLANAGPKRGTDEVPGQSSMGLYRDLFDRRSAVLIGPMPDHIIQLFSTNPLDREARAAQQSDPNMLGIAS